MNPPGPEGSLALPNEKAVLGAADVDVVTAVEAGVEDVLPKAKGDGAAEVDDDVPFPKTKSEAELPDEAGAVVVVAVEDAVVWPNPNPNPAEVEVDEAVVVVVPNANGLGGSLLPKEKDGVVVAVLVPVPVAVVVVVSIDWPKENVEEAAAVDFPNEKTDEVPAASALVVAVADADPNTNGDDAAEVVVVVVVAEDDDDPNANGVVDGLSWAAVVVAAWPKLNVGVVDDLDVSDLAPNAKTPGEEIDPEAEGVDCTIDEATVVTATPAVLVITEEVDAPKEKDEDLPKENDPMLDELVVVEVPVAVDSLGFPKEKVGVEAVVVVALVVVVLSELLPKLN